MNFIAEMQILKRKNNQLEKQLEDIKLKLSTPETAGLEKEPLYKRAALIVCENHRLKEQLVTALLKKDNINDAIEHCKTCSKTECSVCDGILSEKWTGEGDINDPST